MKRKLHGHLILMVVLLLAIRAEWQWFADLIPERQEMLEYYYNGYVFCGRHAHNPWSVIMCIRALLEDAKYPYRTYWLNTSGNDIIADVFFADILNAFIAYKLDVHAGGSL